MTDQLETQLLQEEITLLRIQLSKERTARVDAEHMLVAYYNMLGPKAKEVASNWRKQNITRVHYTWADEALKLDGERIAQFIMDTNTLTPAQVDFID
jgi:hypothetical protein